jgi:hypothetical protein
MGGRLLPKRARRTLVPPVQFQIISGNPRPWWLHSSPRRRAPRACREWRARAPSWSARSSRYSAARRRPGRSLFTPIFQPMPDPVFTNTAKDCCCLLTFASRVRGQLIVSGAVHGVVLRRLSSTTRPPWRSVILALGHRSHAARYAARATMRFSMPARCSRMFLPSSVQMSIR